MKPVSFVNKKQSRIVHGQAASNINCSTLVFIFAVIAAFQNQSPTLPMATNMQVSKDIPVFCVAVLSK